MLERFLRLAAIVAASLGAPLATAQSPIATGLATVGGTTFTASAGRTVTGMRAMTIDSSTRPVAGADAYAAYTCGSFHYDPNPQSNVVPLKADANGIVTLPTCWVLLWPSTFERRSHRMP